MFLVDGVGAPAGDIDAVSFRRVVKAIRFVDSIRLLCRARSDGLTPGRFFWTRKNASPILSLPCIGERWRAVWIAEVTLRAGFGELIFAADGRAMVRQQD